MMSLIIAFILMFLPIPMDWQWIRPNWVALVLIYWIFVSPSSIGVITGWVAGLSLDILGGSLLGQHALSLAIIAYLAQILRYRLRLFSFWQQALSVLVLVGLGQFVELSVQWFIGHPPQSILYWVPSLSSLCLWPLIVRVLKAYERKISLQ